MRVYKTEKNLQTILDQLDNSCGSLDNALATLGFMSGLPESIKQGIDRIDFSAIVGLKNEVEMLIEKMKGEI